MAIMNSQALYPGSSKAVKKPVAVGPQNVGLPGYRPGDAGNPYPKPVQGQAVGPDPNFNPNAGLPAAPAAPIDWKTLVAKDPEGALQHQYLDTDNTLTTKALREAWLQHTQSSQDSFNAHGALFSGANANARNSIKNTYTDDVERQKLAYDKGGHDINTSVFNRLMAALTATGTTSGTTL